MRPDDHVTINRELLALAATKKGGYAKTQLAALGVPWPPPKGWKATVIGRRIPRSAFDALMTPTQARDTKSQRTRPNATARRTGGTPQ